MNIPQIITLVALAGVVVAMSIAVRNLRQASRNWAAVDAYNQVAAAYRDTSRAWNDLTAAINRGAGPEEQAELQACAERFESEAQALREETARRFSAPTDARSTT